MHINARRLKCAQDVTKEVLAYVNAPKESVDAGEPMDVDGIQEKRESAKQDWTADDAGSSKSGYRRVKRAREKVSSRATRGAWGDAWRWPVRVVNSST